MDKYPNYLIELSQIQIFALLLVIFSAILIVLERTGVVNRLAIYPTELYLLVGIIIFTIAKIYEVQAKNEN